MTILACEREGILEILLDRSCLNGCTTVQVTGSGLSARLQRALLLQDREVR